MRGVNVLAVQERLRGRDVHAVVVQILGWRPERYAQRKKRRRTDAEGKDWVPGGESVASSPFEGGANGADRHAFDDPGEPPVTTSPSGMDRAHHGVWAAAAGYHS
ncbi:hypothetical protein GCM10029976_064690 [Kribbella albertanoniae]